MWIKNKKALYAIIITVASAIPIVIGVFKDSLELHEKTLSAGINVNIQKAELDGYKKIALNQTIVFPSGIQYEMILSHNHDGKESIIINSININVKKLSDDYNCQSSPNLNDIKGAGTIVPLRFRTSIYGEDNIKTKLTTKDKKVVVLEGNKLLSGNENFSLKISDSDDDSEIMKGYILLKEKRLFKFNYTIQYSALNRSESINTEDTFLCL